LIFSTRSARVGVEPREQRIKVVDQLRWWQLRRNLGKADQVGKQHRHFVEAVGDDGFTLVQAPDDLLRQDVQQQLFVLLFLAFQLFKVQTFPLAPTPLLQTRVYPRLE
jgi:hypothetical protein